MLFRYFFIQSINLTAFLVNFLIFTAHFHQDQFTATITKFLQRNYTINRAILI